MEQLVTAYRQKLANVRAAHRQEAQRLANELAEAGAAKIILFGSVAQRTDSFSSDIDLVAISAEVQGVPFHERTANALLKLNPPGKVHLLIYTEEEWEALCASRWFVCHEMGQKGVVLYERPG